MYASQLINSDPFPGVYSDGVRCRVHHDTGYGPRRGEKPRIEPRPEFNNNPNPVLTQFREMGYGVGMASLWLTRPIAAVRRANSSWSEKEIRHARKVFQRLVALSEGK